MFVSIDNAEEKFENEVRNLSYNRIFTFENDKLIFIILVLM